MVKVLPHMNNTETLPEKNELREFLDMNLTIDQSRRLFIYQSLFNGLSFNALNLKLNKMGMRELPVGSYKRIMNNELTLFKLDISWVNKLALRTKSTAAIRQEINLLS